MTDIYDKKIKGLSMGNMYDLIVIFPVLYGPDITSKPLFSYLICSSLHKTLIKTCKFCERSSNLWNALLLVEMKRDVTGSTVWVGYEIFKLF